MNRLGFSGGDSSRRRCRPMAPAGRCLQKQVLVLIGATIIGSLVSPAMGASKPSTRLIRCGEESCLQISGRRDDRAMIVSVNGHVVAVEGKRRWRVRLPVEVVRQWSAPYARTIEISLRDPETQGVTIASVDLPIGLLGGLKDLASLVISVR